MPATEAIRPPAPMTAHEPEGFRAVRLPRSGARPASIVAADIWSGEVETSGADGALIRHEARLLVDADGAPFLHLHGRRLVEGAVVAWHAALANAEGAGALRAALDAYDPARLVGGFDEAAGALLASLGSDAEKWRAFAEEAARVKRDLVELVERLGRPGLATAA